MEEELETGWLDDETPQESPKVEKPPAVASAGRSRFKRPAALIKADRKLSHEQRYYKRLLVECSTLTEAEARLRDAGFGRERTTLYRWRQTPKFAEALQLEQDYLLKCAGIDKAKLLLDAEKVKQLALTPKPVLFRGQDTGYTERELGAALRAIEFQGRGVGIGVEDPGKVQVNIDIDFSGRATSQKGETIDGEGETLSVS